MKIVKQDYEERRAYPRYPIRDSSAVMLSPDNIISFNLLDVSESGMAFCYNGKRLESKVLDKAFITFFGENVGVSDIPVTIIFDKEVDTANIWFVNESADVEIPYLRRCGVAFGELSEHQKNAIDSYIQLLHAS